MALNANDIARGESATLEFKLTLPKDSEKYIRTVIAFANCQGGRIIFGVDDHSRSVTGINGDDLFPMMDAIANAISDSCTPQIIPEIEPQTIDGKNVIVVHVGPQPRRPYYLSSKGRDEGTYVRVGATTRPASEDKITDLLMEGKRISWDELSCMDFHVTKEQIDSLCNAIRKFRRDAGLPDRQPDVGQLLSLKVLKQDEQGLQATNAFALLSSDFFQFAKIQCALFKGSERVVFLDKKDCEGPVYAQIDEAVKFVLRNIRLGVTIGNVVRHEKYELPPEAIREMIINAVCHRDYRAPSCVQVAVFDDRLEVSSPGGLYNGLSFKEMVQGHSRIRNRAIAATFQQMGLIENWGTGIRRICSLAADYQLPVPEFTVTENMFRVELFRQNQNTALIANAKPNGGDPGGNGGDLGGNGGDLGGNGGDDRNQKGNCNGQISLSERLLQAIENDPYASAGLLAKQIGVSMRTTERELSALKKSGTLSRQGSPRTGYWVINR